jgi:hypothetical protein
MGDTMSSVFGQRDEEATDDPNQGLSGGQLFARKALKGSLAGAGQGLKDMNNPNPQPVDFTKLMAAAPMLRPKQPKPPGASPGDFPPTPTNSFYGD